MEEYQMKNKIISTLLEIKIQEAKAFLRKNGYIVKKLTQDMQKDLDECDKLEGNKDCSGCSCSVCIVQ